MTYQEKCIGMLTDAYEKGKQSNNYKLFDIVTNELDQLYKAINDVRDAIDIDLATGETLTKLAKNVNQDRGTVNDVVLRVLIKAKIAADMSEGTINTILAVNDFIFGGLGNDKASITEFPDGEPAAFRIAAPLDAIVAANVTLNQYIQIMLRVKAGGVAIIADFQGSFEYGSIDQYGPPYDTGFANDEQTTGGTIGALYDPVNDDPLPI